MKGRDVLGGLGELSSAGTEDCTHLGGTARKQAAQINSRTIHLHILYVSLHNKKQMQPYWVLSLKQHLTHSLCLGVTGGRKEGQALRLAGIDVGHVPV